MADYLDVSLSPGLKQFDKNKDGKIDESEAGQFLPNSLWQAASQGTQKLTINGKMDRPVFQGQTSDCGLISSLLAFSFSKKGQKVVSNMIDLKNKNKGQYSVKLSK